MNAQRINITLPADLARDFKRTVPNGERSKFIAETLEGELKRVKIRKNLKKEWAKSLRENYDYYKKIGKEIDEDFKYADAEVLDRLP